MHASGGDAGAEKSVGHVLGMMHGGGKNYGLAIPGLFPPMANHFAVDALGVQDFLNLDLLAKVGRRPQGHKSGLRAGHVHHKTAGRDQEAQGDHFGDGDLVADVIKYLA